MVFKISATDLIAAKRGFRTPAALSLSPEANKKGLANCEAPLEHTQLYPPPIQTVAAITCSTPVLRRTAEQASSVLPVV